MEGGLHVQKGGSRKPQPDRVVGGMERRTRGRQLRGGSRVGLQHEKGGGCREEDRHGIEAQGQACQRRDGSASSLLTAFFLHLYNGDAQSR